MTAEMANRPSLMRRGATPDVEAAISDERTAAMPLPHDDRLRLRITSMISPHRIKRTIAIVLLLVRLTGPTTGRGMVQPDVLLSSQFHWKSTLSPMRARAKVARARGRPPSRSAGNATRRPISPVTISATSMAANSGTWYCVMSSPVVSPAMVEKVAWARLTMPPMPVTTTKDKKMMERARPCTIVPAQNALARKRT